MEIKYNLPDGSARDALSLVSEVYRPFISGLEVIQDDAAVPGLTSLVESIVERAGKTSEAFGSNNDEHKSITEWLDRIGSGSIDEQVWEEHLLSRTYLVGNNLTVADIALAGSVHKTMAASANQLKMTQPCLTRHFDLIQHTPSIATAIKHANFSPDVVSIDLDDVPTTKSPAEAQVSKPAGGAGKGDSKKDKKQKEKGQDKPAQKKGQPAKAPEVGPPMPWMIDLRIGKIVDVRRHPDADSLYVEQIDFGESEGPRTVVSGLVKYVPEDQMKDRLLVGVCNLKPAKMRGVTSSAMVLCATHKDGRDGGIEIVSVPEGAQPGDRVVFEGFETEKPLDQLNPKKKQWETIQPGFTTLETKEAAWRDPADSSKLHKIVVASKGTCSAPTFIGASLS